MKHADKDSPGFKAFEAMVRADIDEGRPLRAIATIAELWDDRTRRKPVIRDQAAEWLREAITAARGDAGMFSRSFRKDRNVEMAIKVGCGHMFWIEAQQLYGDMLTGKQKPEDVYLLIQEDLKYSGRAAPDRAQPKYAQYALAKGQEATMITDALNAMAQGAPVSENVRADMRAVLERVMEKQLQRAHLPPMANSTASRVF